MSSRFDLRIPLRSGGIVRFMSQAVTRHLGDVFQLLGIAVFLCGLYFLVGPAWTAVSGGLLLVVVGMVMELQSSPKRPGGA